LGEAHLVAEVSFGEWTREGHIRHSVFHGLRIDKKAETIIREKPVHAAPAKPEAKPAPAPGRLPASLQISHPFVHNSTVRMCESISTVGSLPHS
jgi:bifunctional non-homologous end joining protein LigD